MFDRIMIASIRICDECRKLNLLSFGEEAEAEEQAVEIVKAKIKSSHDVLQDPRLLKEPVESAEVVRILVSPCSNIIQNQEPHCYEQRLCFDSHILFWQLFYGRYLM